MLDQFRDDPEHEARQIFRMSKEDLTMFFGKRNLYLHVGAQEGTEKRVSLDILRDCNYANPGLCNILNTNPQTGITAEVQDVERRKRVFGNNKLPLPKMDQFWTHILPRQYESPTVQGLLIVTMAYFVFTLKIKPTIGFFAALSIFFGVFLTCFVQALMVYKEGTRQIG